MQERLLKIADIIPLTKEILSISPLLQTKHSFSLPDAVVYASMLQHLSATATETNCFINSNKKDFDSPDIEDELAKYNCKILFRFNAGYSYIQSQMR